MLDFATIKYNTDGIEQWAVRYNRAPDGDERALGVHTSTGGAVYISGFGNYMPSSNTPAELITIKYVQSLSDALEISDITPSNYLLQQNYPNPFNPVTKIKYTIPSTPLSFGEGLGVRLIVYDVLGNEVATLVNEQKPAGIYEVEFNASQLSSGIYYYKLTAGSFTETKKMLLLK